MRRVSQHLWSRHDARVTVVRRRSCGARSLKDDQRPKPAPVRIRALEGERMGDVSCGVSHTLASSAIVEETQGDGNDRMKVMTGGRLYVAGPTNVLGRYCPTFTRVQARSLRRRTTPRRRADPAASSSFVRHRSASRARPPPSRGALLLLLLAVLGGRAAA